MKKHIFLCLASATIILSGCGSQKASTEPSNAASAPISAESSNSVVEKVLTDNEKMALEYINVFLNGSDQEAREAFISNKIHPDVQSLFQLVVNVQVPEVDKLNDPKVIESTEYTDAEGGKDTAILIQGKKGTNPTSELIVLFKDNKITWGIHSNDEDFAKLRSSFKEPIPETADEPSPEKKLSEIRNYIVADLWNAGFVDVSSYIHTGTSSTGQNLDVEFTVDLLGNSMAKKAEYDEYVKNLDEKYAQAKKIWTKLSEEADRLYQHIQDNPPKANDPNSNFDTGKFKQYMSAFTDEVDSLNN
ncbi:hypothetical protein [Paenibacillus sp. FSL K6-1230]|uniref:hypothetical protein n=1 Tax=Paenibacillus sp. FSL K6-1230 TaxID=2921603 RepID=UPI0030F5A672